MTLQLLLSLVSGIFIAAAAAYLGTLMLSRKMAVIADPLGHLALPGAALALIYGFSLALGAFPFVILGIVLIWLLEQHTPLQTEALTAIVFAAGVGITFLFLPISRAEEALIGDISRVSRGETLLAVVLGAGVILLVRQSYARIMLLSIHEDLAKAEGIHVARYNFIYLLAIAVVVALGVNLVGGLMTSALVAIPAAAARNIGRRLAQYESVAIGFGVAAAVIGILLSAYTRLPAGPLVILASTALFTATLAFARA